MPAMGSGGGGAGIKLPPAPKPTARPIPVSGTNRRGGVLPPPPKPPPNANINTGANPRGVSITARPQVAPRALTTGANPRGVAIAQPSRPPTVNDTEATNPDPASVIKVFEAQPKAQQQAIVAGAQKNPTLPASKIILNYARKAGGLGVSVASVFGPKPTLAQVEAPLNSVGGFIAKLLVHGAMDAYQMPASTVESLYGAGKQAVEGHIGTAAKMFVDPYVQLAEHPLSTLEQHPLNTALMALGPEDAIGRGVGGAMRMLPSDTTRGLASTVRGPL